MRMHKILLLVAAMALPASCIAQSHSAWPARPVKLVVPFAPGGGTDVIARLVAPKYSEALGHQMVIENKPGASGMIGADAVAKAAPDGYTLLMSNNASLSTGPLVYGNAGFHPMNDFIHVVMIGSFANAFLVNANHPAKTLQEFIAMAKTRPGKMSFGSAGPGSAGHLTGEMLKQAAGIDMQHVPYKGTGPAITDLLSGQLDAVFDGLPASTPYVKSGKFRALAISSPQRVPAVPNVPTMTEIVPGVQGQAWFGISAPAKTPREIVERLQVEGQKIVATPEVQARFAEIGMTLSGRGRAEYTEYIAQDIRRWAPVVDAAGVRVK